ncbi:hypothetical protein PHYSODRAFT_299415 [Phytophthora sojae]|uniref:Uncharacterized protein n=1 Tax=Phytophthora sojae (strain P6497) TaxID=1094619 RepID=G4Z7R5_PHYSP|nr:hypothetical protein PHYSODRAFT_299415 [Phytophthora sojae]EGZ21819.1 hypothetical protein PHYSODRAFT_299415 [Phytophthora sojae]|eukprot:XP_009524536.1 hypothetical protein PHYSODRAFT_299415 [Phytophthora sojae]
MEMCQGPEAVVLRRAAAARVDRGAEIVLSTMEIAWRRLAGLADRCVDVVTQFYYGLVLQLMVAEPLVYAKMEMLVGNTLGATRIGALHSGSLAVTVSCNRSVGMPCTALRNPGRLGHATSVLGSLVNSWCRKIGVDAFAHQPSLKGAALSQATQAVSATRPAASGCGVDAFVHHWFSTNHR